MAITSKNFCHIEEVEGGIKVLFYVEYDGDDAIMHQVVSCDVGTVDFKISMKSESWEKYWPDEVRFADAAARAVETVREMGAAFD